MATQADLQAALDTLKSTFTDGIGAIEADVLDVSTKVSQLLARGGVDQATINAISDLTTGMANRLGAAKASLDAVDTTLPALDPPTTSGDPTQNPG